MITSIVLNNFKCFRNQEINLAELTLFTGLNNSGKSSVFQAIRMISKWRKGLDPILAGHGSLYECKNKNSSANSSMEIVCKFQNENLASMRVDFSDTSKTSINKIDTDSELLPLISYLSADRWGPRVSLPLYTSSDELSNVGEYGEYVLDYLTRHETDIVPPLLRHPNAEGETLEYNVRAWLGEISPNVVFKHASEAQRDSSFATLDGFRPTNTGYGLSYTLPIIVSILGIASSCPCQSGETGVLDSSSKPLVIIENPEAHLHPRGQVKMGMLLAKASKSGLQVMVESHSDHIFNGLRIAVHEGILTRNEVKVYFFSRNADGETNIISPKMDKDGRIDKWPDGFFDEWDKSLEKLLFPSEVANGTDI
jgi:predicted ATPase